jgi:hypothetical protein
MRNAVMTSSTEAEGHRAGNGQAPGARDEGEARDHSLRTEVMEVTVGAHPVAFLESVRRREAARSSESLAHTAATTSSTVASDSNGNGTWDERTSDDACHGNGVQSQQTNSNETENAAVPTKRLPLAGDRERDLFSRAKRPVRRSLGDSERDPLRSRAPWPSTTGDLDLLGIEKNVFRGCPSSFVFLPRCSAIPIIASPANVRGRRTGSPSADRA